MVKKFYTEELRSRLENAKESKDSQRVLTLQGDLDIRNKTYQQYSSIN